MRLTTRISLIVLFVVFTVLTINILIVRQQLIEHEQASQRVFALTLTRSLADAVIQNVILGENAELSQLLEATQSNNKQIEYLYVIGMRGQLSAHSFKRGFPIFLEQAIKKQQQLPMGGRNSLMLTGKYQVDGHGLVYGYKTPLINGLKASLHIGLNQSEITEAANKTSQVSFGVAMLLAVLGSMVVWFATRYATKPLVNLIALLKQHETGANFDLSGFMPNGPELHQLKATLTSVFHARDVAEREVKEREQDLEITLNSIGDGVIATNKLGLITRMNPVAEKLTGWTLGECKGKSIKTVLNIIDETTRLPIDNPIDKVLMEGGTIYLSNHTTLISKDGREYQIADSAAPIRNDSNEILGLVLVFNDVTEQYKLREEARRAQRQTENVLEKMHVMVAILDMDVNILFANLPILELMGKQLTDVIGVPMMQIPRLAQESQLHHLMGVALDKLVNESKQQSLDVQVTINQRQLDLQINLTPLINEQGQPYQFLFEAYDITLRKKAENKLQSSLQQQQEILNTLGDGVITVSETGAILSVNRSAEGLFGLSLEQALGQSISMILASSHKADITSRLQALATLTEGNLLAESFNAIGFHQDNGEFPMRLSLRQLSKEGAYQQHFVVSCHDLTQEQAQQSQLQRAQKMDALGKLVGGIAHDYNNMLGIVLGYTDLIDMKFPEVDGLKKYTANIAQAGERGKALTKRMLNFSKKQSTEASVVDIDLILNEQKELISKPLTALIQLNYDLCPSPWLILVDPSELEDCLLNLAINAGHAMPNGGALTFTTENASIIDGQSSMLGLTPGDYLTLMVADNGCGMDEATADKIFDPFFSTKGADGTGLGLSQAYGLMERSGGTIKVNSKIGEGSSFVLYFPKYNGEVIVATKDDASTGIKQGAGKTVLVVDDEPTLRSLAEEILSHSGYRVYTAKDGIVAQEVLATKKVDYLLSDIIMPHMDGFELAQKVANDYPDIKIQLVSGFSDQRGMFVDSPLHSNILYKPYTAVELLNKMADLSH